MMPRHYLFVMWEGFGTVPPELGVARRLIARGHRVTVLADDSVREEAETVGAAFLGYEKAPNRASRDRDDDPVKDWTAPDPIESIKLGVTGFMCDPALGVALDVLECHRRDPVDVVVGCALRFGTVMAAEKAGLPSVVLFPNVDFRWAPGRPGFGPGLPPLAGPEGEARDAEIWAVAREAFAVGQPALDHARRELDLPPTTHPWDEWDRATRALLLTSRHFDYPYETPERTIFAGPILDDPVWAGEAADLPNATSDPLVLVSLGCSFQDQRDEYRRVITALGELSVRAIVTLGDVFDVEEFEAPANVDVVRAAPHAPILRAAAAVVTHGGHGSVIKSLAAGVPIVCLPLGRDQAENGARAQWHGAGIMLDRAAPSAEITEAVGQLLSDVSFRDAAVQLSRKIAEEIAAGIPVRELEEVAAGHAVAGASTG